jgi:DNA-damage-inducible protein D
MKQETIKSLTKNFESYSNKTENGIEFWFARNLQYLLGYTEWRNFLKVISKAKIVCETSGREISDRFADVNKTIKMPKNA